MFNFHIKMNAVTEGLGKTIELAKVFNFNYLLVKQNSMNI